MNGDGVVDGLDLAWMAEAVGAATATIQTVYCYVMIDDYDDELDDVHAEIQAAMSETDPIQQGAAIAIAMDRATTYLSHFPADPGLTKVVGYVAFLKIYGDLE